jgi:hypothetical protein
MYFAEQVALAKNVILSSIQANLGRNITTANDTDFAAKTATLERYINPSLQP